MIQEWVLQTILMIDFQWGNGVKKGRQSFQLSMYLILSISAVMGRFMSVQVVVNRAGSAVISTADNFPFKMEK